jgi:lipopolysaccharide export system permease protein
VRILTRYLLREFLLPFFYCLDAFLLLWLVMDLFGRLDDFIEAKVTWLQAARYYVLVFPEALVQITPMALLLGLLFSLANLAKHNELLAMRAGGISLLRVAAPLWGIGLLAALIVGIIHEVFVPGAREKANTLMKIYRGKAVPDIVEHIFFTNLQANRDWYIPRLNTRTGELTAPEIHERNPDGSPRRDIFAQRARWTGAHWIFQTVDVYDHTAAVSPPPVERFQQISFPQLNETPQRLVTENKLPVEMTSRELRRTLRALDRAGHHDRAAPLRATLHHRYAFPATCFFVIWIGLPLGLRIRRSGALLSVGTALILFVGYYIATQITFKLAAGGHLPAPLAAWLVNLVFFVAGGVLLWRVR